MLKPLDFFELFNNWLQEKERILNNYKGFRLINATFKGIGQILFCCSSLSGLLFLAAFAFSWWVIVPHCLVGSAIATLTAFLFSQKSVDIENGLFGYNGALIGLTWPFFWPLSYFSILILILASGISTFYAILLRNTISDSKVNLPITSIPFVVIFLLFLSYAYVFGLLPKYSSEPIPLNLSALDVTSIHQRIFQSKEWLTLGKLLLNHIVPVGIFFTGILLYSRISAFFAFAGGSLSLITSYFLMGDEGLNQLGLHGFTSVPIAIALGGFFIAFNIPCFLYSMFATCLGILLWLLIAPLLAPHGIPILTIVFNAIIILFILPLKLPYFATKLPWLFAVSLNRTIRPEETLREYKLHKSAALYWKNIK
ncbi:MAG: urea transporter [Candidatus Scalindua sp.]